MRASPPKPCGLCRGKAGSFGFKDIPAYSGGEIPEAYRRHWVFMELALTAS